jgi:sugar lactone lactonase YvrE
MRRVYFAFLLVAAAALHAPLYATVTFDSMTSNLPAPQPLGTQVVWTVTATDSNPGPLMFQFNVTSPSGAFSMVYDFDLGISSNGVWATQFVWATIAGEGVYQVQVVAKDFNSGETQTQSLSYQLAPLSSGGEAVVSMTANPLVALFSAPACPFASAMQVTFQQVGNSMVNTTDWKPCTGNTSMNFYVAGMYPSSTYSMNYQVQTGGAITPGPGNLSFTTGALPSSVTFPVFDIVSAAQDSEQPVVLQSLGFVTNGVPHFPVATDLTGQIIWYYDPVGPALLTRMLPGETMLDIQGGASWNSYSEVQQILREFDLAGNVVHQTNTGVIQQELLALGAVDGGPCSAIPNPAPVGSACLTFFNHEITRFPNGYTAALATLEKIFPVGTQGSTSPLPVDVEGDMIVVLDANWQVVWYWDSFNPAGGGNGYPNLPVSRAAIMGETCVAQGDLCGPVFLAGMGTSTTANDWLHGNCIYYLPSSGDILLSMRSQDWVIKIDYNNGAGTGDILWRMGNEGDFTFNNINKDPWPWFSGQHDVEYANFGAGPLTVFDDGNTRRANPPLGLGADACEPSYCTSRGMALTVDESNMTVTPVLSQYLGESAIAYGSAELLLNGNYYFDAGLVGVDLNYGYGIEVLPTAGTIQGTNTFNVQTQPLYRSYRVSNLYQQLMDLPATLTVTAGNGQSIGAGQAFSPLQVTVTDPNGVPLWGIAVTFTITPGASGASGTFSATPSMPVLTNTSGIATAPALTANGIAGTFTVTASVNTLNVNFTLTNLLYNYLAAYSATVENAAGGGSVLLVTPGAWTASSNASWLQISPGSTSGTGNALIQFSYSANPNATARTGTLTIAGLTYTVTQTGAASILISQVTRLILSGVGVGVAVDGLGNVYVTDTANNAVREWSASTQLVTTLVSSGLDHPAGVAVDSQGNVYFADNKNNAIKEWSVSTGAVTSLVSSGLISPVGVAVDSQGNVYFSDTGHNAIDEWNAATRQVTILVDDVDNKTLLNIPLGVAVDADGNVYVANAGNNTIKKWSVATKALSTLVSSGLSTPYGVAVDGDGNVYIADSGHKAIKEWSPASAQVTVLVSTGLDVPTGVAVDGQGNVYIADAGAGVVEKYSAIYLSLGATSRNEGAAAGTDSISFQVLPASTVVTATSNQSWLTITGVSGGAIGFSFSANTSASSRSAQISVLGQIVTVTQSGDAPASIVKIAGMGQSTPEGQVFPIQLEVQVKDAAGQNIQGASVTFTMVPEVTGSAGTFASSPPMPILTNSSGDATAPTLTANNIAGEFTVTVSVGTLSTIFGATVTP